MIDFSAENTGGVVAATGAGVSALGAIAWYFRRLRTSFATEAVSTSRAQAEMDIIERLRTELVRMSDHNSKMSGKLNELQITVTELHLDIAHLRVENGELRNEISGLHVELTKLRERAGLLSR